MTNKEALRRLGELGKSREWLKDATGYSINSLYNILAGEERPLNDRMDRAFRTAFQTAEGPAQPIAPPLPDSITLQATAEEFQAWDQASRKAKAPSLKDWALATLNNAAAGWHQNHPPPPKSFLRKGLEDSEEIRQVKGNDPKKNDVRRWAGRNQFNRPQP